MTRTPPGAIAGDDAVLADREAARRGPQHAGGGGPVQVGVEDSRRPARAGERGGEPGGHEALAHPALAAHDRHHVPDPGETRAHARVLGGDLRAEIGPVLAGHLVVGPKALHGTRSEATGERSPHLPQALPLPTELGRVLLEAVRREAGQDLGERMAPARPGTPSRAGGRRARPGSPARRRARSGGRRRSRDRSGAPRVGGSRAPTEGSSSRRLRAPAPRSRRAAAGRRPGTRARSRFPRPRPPREWPVRTWRAPPHRRCRRAGVSTPGDPRRRARSLPRGRGGPAAPAGRPARRGTPEDAASSAPPRPTCTAAWESSPSSRGPRAYRHTGTGSARRGRARTRTAGAWPRRTGSGGAPG